MSGGIEGWIPGDATEIDMKEWVSRNSWRCVAFFLEKVNAMPGQGVTSCFTFGTSFGFMMALGMGCGRFEFIRPQVWQQALGCMTKGDKNVSKSRAQQLFPAFRITHHNADAILIAEYARRKVIEWGITEAPKQINRGRRNV
jgi:hypothetical protein